MNFPNIVHPNLGLLRYNSEYDWYEGQVTFRQLQIPICLDTDDEGKIESVLSRVNHFVIQLEQYSEKAKDYAVNKMLELKNSVWLDENEKPLTSEQFKNHMVLESIVIRSEGDVEFYHSDGEMFLGHCILVTMDVSNHFIDAHIAG